MKWNHQGWHSTFYTVEPLHSLLGDRQHGTGEDVTEKKLGQEPSSIGGRDEFTFNIFLLYNTANETARYCRVFYAKTTAARTVAPILTQRRPHQVMM